LGLHRITISDLSVECIIGVNPRERVEKQRVLINIDLWADLSDAVKTDMIQRTVDYKAIKNGVIQFVSKSSFYLLETLADRVAQLCLEDPMVRKVRVKVEKPGALTGARSVGVQVIKRRTGNRFFVAVGSNVNPEENVMAALKLLSKKVDLTAISTVYRTKAISTTPQPDYLNCVVEGFTELDPISLKFGVLRRIESHLRRERKEDKYAERSIDLDLVIYGDLVRQDEMISLPHPDLMTRPFVAIPLSEIQKDLKVPGREVKVGDLIKGMSREGMIPLTEYTESLRKFIGIR